MPDDIDEEYNLVDVTESCLLEEHDKCKDPEDCNCECHEIDDEEDLVRA